MKAITFLKPNLVDIEMISDTKSKIVIQPLERGFGHTLGNALRRILLSSMPGSAVTEVSIDNILHEYSTIEGVQEDVIDILLNLKDLSIRLTEVEDASPHKLIELTFKDLNKNLLIIRQKLNDNVKIGGLESAKAVAAFEILKSSLNFESGGEIAKNLEQIYNYSLNQLHLILKDEKEHELDTVISIIGSLVDAWSSISVNN